MSLDNIQLSAIVIQDLFKKGLIDSKIEQGNLDLTNEQKISYLGKNEKQIVILTNNKNTPFLPDDELNFLIGILNACKLNLNDVAIVNYASNASLNYEAIQHYFSAIKVLAFGISMDDLNLPLQFPSYQIQHYNEVIYLQASSLQLLKNNKEEKSKLWASLQKIFSI